MDRLTLTKEQRKAEGVGYLQYLAPAKAKAFDKRLSEYEDTGLTPDEIHILKAECSMFEYLVNRPQTR